MPHNNEMGLETLRQVRSRELPKMSWLITLVLLETMAVTPPASTASNFDSLLKRSLSLIKTGQSASALPLLRKAVIMKPGSAEAHANLGWVLFQMKQVDGALQEEKRAIKLEPRSADAHHFLGSIYLSQSMYQEAADQFRQSLRLDPNKRCNCGPIEGLLLMYPPAPSAKRSFRSSTRSNKVHPVDGPTDK